jgi:hypothetical protein
LILRAVACTVAAVTLLVAGLAQPLVTSRAAYFSFDAANDLGQSCGPTPWPVYAFHAQAATGKAGGCLSMGGVDANGLMLPNPAAFFGEKAERGTIALWVRPGFDPGADEGERVVFDFMREAGNSLIDGYEIAMVASKDTLWAQGAITERMIIPSPLKKGQWTHLALAWDCQTGSVLYVDGKRVAERKNKFEPTPLSWWPGRVGAFTPWGGFPFKGDVDELHLYDRMLGDDEIAATMGTGPAAVKASTTDWGFRVTNPGDRPVTVHERTWLAEDDTDAQARLWGYVPLAQWEMGLRRRYVGGAVGKMIEGAPVVVGPHETKSVAWAATGLYPRWVRHGLIAGEDVTAREVAAADLPGLTCEAEPGVLYSDKPATVKLTVRNGLGRDFAGTLKGKLAPWFGGDAVVVAPVKAAVMDGEEVTLDLPLSTNPLPPGNYRLEMYASGPKTAGDLRPVVITVMEPTDFRTVFGPGACVVYNNSRELALSMQADGVKVRTYRPDRAFDEDDEIYPYGMKVWYAPAFSANRICRNPAIWEETERLATAMGRTWRDKPGTLNQVMTGEGLEYTPCYCNYCNADFRAYLKTKYGTIAKLNDAWGAKYASFDEIDQIGSPRDVSAAANQMGNMQRKLPEQFSAKWRELFRRDPTRAMEWKRWHEGVLVDWYTRFAAAFHKANGGRTAISEQPCWPNFHSHILFALGKIADLGGMDLYLPGDQPTSLGYPAELFLNFDLNAACFKGKPLWLNELYVQDNSAPGLAEAQGWFLVGRGYSMLTYFTYDWYAEGIRNGVPLLFGLFDKAGKPYPVYPSFQTFSHDSAKFNARYDWTTLRAETPRVAEFLGDDVSLANYLETGGETWEANGVHGHDGAYWLTERNGYAVDFVNDDALAKPTALAGKKALIVPWHHVLRAASARRMLDFARAGGTVILDGPAGVYDENYRPYAAGAAPMRELGVEMTGYEDAPNSMTLTDGTKLTAQGRAVGLKVTGGDVLAKDDRGEPALVRVKIGQGQVFWLLTSLGRVELGRLPSAGAMALWRGMIEAAGAKPLHEIRAKPDPEGKPVCDVSVRYRGGNEAFVFISNFFAPTDAEILLRLPHAEYYAKDAITDVQLALRDDPEGVAFRVSLPAYGARVIRIRSLAGTPFAKH